MVDDGKTAVRRVKFGDEIGTGVIAEEGLSWSDQVIVEGIQSVRLRSWIAWPRRIDEPS